jgi:uncharacterized protein (TIGR00730 family)
MKKITNKKRVKKAYRNTNFLKSREARTLRILAEYLEPAARFNKNQIKDTVVFFGSSRVVDGETAKKNYAYWKKQSLEQNSTEVEKTLKKAEITLKMSKYYDDARELARLLTQWSAGLKNKKHRFSVCSGGGTGIMEAANRGAFDVDKKRSIGLNISLPTEQHSNPYITPALNFEFHYFFMRKFWFIYLAKALVVFPGGFGTMDELFEVLTLIQTKKLQKKMPVVLYGEDYWGKIINFKSLLDHHVIGDKDLEFFKIANSPKEAFLFLKEKLTKFYASKSAKGKK